MDLKETGINTRNWVDSAQDRDYWRGLVNAALNLQVPKAMELVNRHKLNKIKFDKRCINKEERVRHLPGYCP